MLRRSDIDANAQVEAVGVLLALEASHVAFGRDLSVMRATHGIKVSGLDRLVEFEPRGR